MGIGFCGEYILENNIPATYCFSSAYFSNGTCLQGTKPSYKTVDCGPKYSSGDVVGCGIDWKRESYFFTLNGQKHSKFHVSPGMKHQLNCTTRDYTKWRTPSEKTLSAGRVLRKIRCSDSCKLPGPFQVHYHPRGARLR
jgi:hypothetical protein